MAATSSARHCACLMLISSQDLITGLLDPDADRRLTADQALNHPWVRMDAVSGIIIMSSSGRKTSGSPNQEKVGLRQEGIHAHPCFPLLLLRWWFHVPVLLVVHDPGRVGPEQPGGEQAGAQAVQRQEEVQGRRADGGDYHRSSRPPYSPSSSPPTHLTLLPPSRHVPTNRCACSSCSPYQVIAANKFSLLYKLKHVTNLRRKQEEADAAAAPPCQEEVRARQGLTRMTPICWLPSVQGRLGEEEGGIDSHCSMCFEWHDGTKRVWVMCVQQPVPLAEPKPRHRRVAGGVSGGQEAT